MITADELVELVREPRATEPEDEPEEEAAPKNGGRRRGSAPPASPARRAVLRVVRTADKPLHGGTVAEAAKRADPTLAGSDWAGAGGFFGWLAAVVPELGTASKPSPGWVWDPKRFSEADLPGAEGTAWTCPRCSARWSR